MQAASKQETADAVAESMVSASSFTQYDPSQKPGWCISICYIVLMFPLDHWSCCMSDMNCNKQESAAQTRQAKEETAGVQQALDAAKV